MLSALLLPVSSMVELNTPSTAVDSAANKDLYNGYEQVYSPIYDI
jgi:hypothetical protein